MSGAHRWRYTQHVFLEAWLRTKSKSGGGHVTEHGIHCGGSECRARLLSRHRAVWLRGGIEHPHHHDGLVVGQFLGSIAALVGGYCLVGYVGTLAGRGDGFGWSAGVAALMVFVSATALLQTALLAPKANAVALLLASLPLSGPRLVAGPLAAFVPGSRVLGPLVAGVLIAAPAILAVIAAIVWAPEGAALGFS